MFYFQSQMQFGHQEDKFFQGPLHQSKPENNQNGYFLVPSSRLLEPTEPTMQIIKAASIIITDNALDVDKFLKSLKKKMLQDLDRWRNCSQTRFIILKGANDLKRIDSIMKPGSDVKNTDIMDRAFFLGSILKHIDSAIWQKVDKEQYIRKFACIGHEIAFEEVASVWALQLLAEQIESKFSEDESPMHQITCMETMQKIREGEFMVEDKAPEENAEENREVLEMQRKQSE